MADVFTLDSSYLARKRKEIADDIATAKYKVGSSWYTAKIESTEVLSDGRVEVKFIIDHTVTGNITVTRVELYDWSGRLIGGKNVSVTRADAVEGILYVCRLSLFQVTKNSSGSGSYDAV